jgi:hypothetical protein
MALFVFALCVFFVSKALIEKKKKNAAQAHCIIMVIFAMVIFIIVHWGIHYAANVFASPTEISGRLFSPILTALLIILASLLELVALASNHKAIPILFSMGIVLCLITYQYPRVEKYSMNMHESGKGYTANNIRNSELIKIIRDLPASETYVSNEPAMLLFYADKLAYNIYIIPPEKHFIKVIFIARLLASDGESAINIINATKKDCTVTFQNVDGLVADCYSP